MTDLAYRNHIERRIKHAGFSEADEVFCPHVLEHFFAVGIWYRSFEQLDDEAVIHLLDENRRHAAGPGPGP